MGKKEQIKYWKESATESWESALYLAKGKYYSLSLFAMHLTLEKLFKALWVKKSVVDNPPFTHDLQKLCEELEIDITAAEFDYLAIVNGWNIRGRYPDYTKRLYQKATSAYMKDQILKVQKLKEWLEEKI